MSVLASMVVLGSTEQTALAVMIPAFLGITTLVVKFGQTLNAHTSDTDHHPKRKEMVTESTCAARVKAVETSIKALDGKVMLVDRNNLERHQTVLREVGEVKKGILRLLGEEVEPEEGEDTNG